MFATTDGGATWSSKTSGTDKHLASASFVDHLHGFAWAVGCAARKDLDPAAEEFIVEWAREVHRRSPLALQVHDTGIGIPPEALARAWQAQIRLHERHRHLTRNGKLATVATG